MCFLEIKPPYQQRLVECRAEQFQEPIDAVAW